MNKEDIANIILNKQVPKFKCPIDDCNSEKVDPFDFLEHLKLDHSFRDLLSLFDWDIKDGNIVLIDSHNSHFNHENDIRKNLDEIVCVNDSNKYKKDIARHLTKYHLNSKMLPNVVGTKFYNAMAHSKHIATVDCWELEKDKLLWSYLVLHDAGKSTAERKIDCILNNSKNNDRLEKAKELAMDKYGEL